MAEKNKPSVLIIGEVFYPEDFIVNDLALDWAKQGYRVEVLTRTPSYPFGKPFKGYKNWIYQTEIHQDIKIHRVAIIPGYRSKLVLKVLNYLMYVVLTSVVAMLIGRRYDRIFIYQTGPLTVAIPGAIIKFLYKKRTIIWTQDLWPDTVYAYGFKKNKLIDLFLKKIVRSIYTRCDLILVSCQGFADRIKQYIGEGKTIDWIPNWPIIDSVSDQVEVLPGRFNFTFAGNIGKVQNLENVLLAFKETSSKYDDVWLNIIGDGSNLNLLKEMVHKEGIRNVNFTGRKLLQEMPQYYAASDVLLISLVDHPIYELMIPSKFQTYLQYAKPVFAVMKGEVPQLLQEHNVGFSANPSLIEDIVMGFERFLKLNSVEIKKIENSATVLLMDSFSKKKNIQKITQHVFPSSLN